MKKRCFQLPSTKILQKRYQLIPLTMTIFTDKFYITVKFKYLETQTFSVL